jgi:hypothetical protein
MVQCRCSNSPHVPQSGAFRAPCLTDSAAGACRHCRSDCSPGATVTAARGVGVSGLECLPLCILLPQLVRGPSISSRMLQQTRTARKTARALSACQGPPPVKWSRGGPCLLASSTPCLLDSLTPWLLDSSPCQGVTSCAPFEPLEVFQVNGFHTRRVGLPLCYHGAVHRRASCTPV